MKGCVDAAGCAPAASHDPGLVGLCWAWLGNNSDQLQVILVLASALAAFLVIWHGSRISRREKTIEIVRESLADERGAGLYASFKDCLLEIEAASRKVEDCADAGDDPELKRWSDTLIGQINYYELVALGIRKGVFDEKFYRLWFKTQVLKDYGKLSGYIKSVRKTHGPSYFTEFRWLVRRWNSKEHPETKPTRVVLVWDLVRGRNNRVMAALERQMRAKSGPILHEGDLED